MLLYPCACLMPYMWTQHFTLPPSQSRAYPPLHCPHITGSTSQTRKKSLSPATKKTPCRLKGGYSLAHRLVRRFEMQAVQNRSPGAIFSSLLLVPKTMNFMHKASQRLVKTASCSVFKSWIIVQVKFPLLAIYKTLIEKKFWFSYK